MFIFSIFWFECFSSFAIKIFLYSNGIIFMKCCFSVIQLFNNLKPRGLPVWLVCFLNIVLIFFKSLLTVSSRRTISELRFWIGLHYFRAQISKIHSSHEQNQHLSWDAWRQCKNPGTALNSRAMNLMGSYRKQPIRNPNFTCCIIQWVLEARNSNCNVPNTKLTFS